MIDDIMLYIGSIVLALWGITHVIPTKKIVDSFGVISEDNKRIITMEWIGTGLALFFIGFLVFVVTFLAGSENLASQLVYILSSGTLLILSIVHLFTGARTPILPIKLCPVIMTAVAILFLLGNLF